MLQGGVFAALLISPQRYQQSMNIISGTEVGRAVSTDSYVKVQ